MNCRQFFAWVLTFVAWVSTFVAIIGLPIWYTLKVMNADILLAFRYSRYNQMITVVLIFASMSAMIVHYICARQQSVHSHGSHTTDIVYVFLLGGSSFIGYLQLFASYIAFWGNDEALTYTGVDELILDIVFILSIIVFIPTVAYYVLFFVPYHSKAEKTAWLIIVTLISGVLQKFGFEFVEYKKHYCHRVMHDESSFHCPNWNDSGVFKHTVDEMTKRAQFLHQLSGFYGAATYTATLDFLLSCGVLLYCHNRTEVHPNDVVINRPDPNPFGVQKPHSCIIFCSWLTIYVALPLKMAAFVWQPTLLSFDEKNWTQAYLNFNILELVIHLVCWIAFSFVFWFWVESCGYAWEEICHLETFKHYKSTLRRYSRVPDLFILIFAFILAFFFFLAKIVCHIYAISEFVIPENEKLAVIVNSCGEFFLLLAFYAQFLVIKRFLLCDAAHYKSLPDANFFWHLALVAALMNIWRFLTIFANKQAFLPFMFTSQPFLDNILLGLESFYPVSNIFSLTAAICWFHVIERMIKTDDHSHHFQSQPQSPSNVNDTITDEDGKAAGSSADQPDKEIEGMEMKEQKVKEVRRKRRKTHSSEDPLLGEKSNQYGTST